ncbi:MAG TPA: flp pilus-assembly TadE/G-like family protein [Propioniciclava tarda]|nr:flp pilus-assembly TadE/G-like family protein [Propioniciclava tarda]HQA30946.1 flp pilus-assembly TadE/G-like family protein [Propioniciclava tarda]HQD60409.1 flp pilus-assembly TadE/G-like family protein [Propioniciclava tarda]
MTASHRQGEPLASEASRGNRASIGRRERGLATWLAAAGLVVLGGVLAAGVVALVLQTHAHRVQGAADLVAITAAQAKNLGTGEPCAAASRAAAASDVEVVACSVGGDELEFVVTVSVRGGNRAVLLGFPVSAEASAHAGVRRGG